MINSEALTNAGINIDTLLKRLMGNEALVKVFVGKFITDTSYTELVSALREKDYKEAEHKSHTLKGMCGNMSLELLFKLFTTQVELLRRESYLEAEEIMNEISPAFSAALSGMRKWLSEL